MNASTRILFVLALLLITPFVAHADGIVERDTYAIGEEVALLIPTSSDPVRIIIDAPEARYRLLDANPAPFIPKSAGPHAIVIRTLDGGEVARDAFNVTNATVTEVTSTYVIAIGAEPRVGENVGITITPAPQGDVEVTIRSPGGRFRYAGPWADSPFVPKEEGPHHIGVAQSGALLAELAFTVGPAREPEPDATIPPETNETNTPTETPNPQPELPGTVEPAQGALEFAFRDSRGRRTDVQANLLRKRTGPDGERFDVEVRSQGRSARKMLIRNLEIEGTAEITANIEDVSPQGLRAAELQKEGPVLKAYAIDLGDLNFTDATVTSVAEGTKLYKCALWNYATRSCQGTWAFVQPITPGEEYNITVFPGDPGYAETGVATVNSRKPIYLPGETAELLMVVLDTGGYLVPNATVTLTVTDPNGGQTIYSTADSTIIEIERGVYRATYPYTTIEGSYGLFVEANAPGVGTIMESLFVVNSTHPFDILRDAPVTTDPFKGPFDASITVIPRTDVDSYALTEVVPIEFGIIDAGGANLSEDAGSTYLTWENLAGEATVHYTLQPPLRTPDLFALGKAFITYVQDSITRVFEEARAWLLAIDPEVSNDQGLVVYADRALDGTVKVRNWTGTVLQSEEDTIMDFGNRLSWQKLRCLRTENQCLYAGNDQGNDINFAVFNTDSWSWSNITQLDPSSLDDQRNIDIECEDNITATECLIVYEDATAANAVFQLRTWNGVTLSGATAVTVTGANAQDFRWITLYPLKDSQTMGITLTNDGGGTGSTPDIYAGIWNGTAFGNWQTITTESSSFGNERTNFRHFDCAWEGGNRQFTCFYGNNSLNGIGGYQWNGTHWLNLGLVYNATAEISEIVACGQDPWSNFTHNEVGVMSCDLNEDLDGFIWNGTHPHKNDSLLDPRENVNAECHDNKGASATTQNFGCKWERSGNEAIFLWVNNGNDFVTYGTYDRPTKDFSNPNWTSGTQIVTDGAADLIYTYLVPNPDSDKIFMVYQDGSRSVGCSIWSGTSWSGTGCNNSAVFEIDGAAANRGIVSYDWFRIPPPQPLITIFTPVGATNVINYSGVLNPSSTSVMAENFTTTAQPPVGTSAPLPGTQVPSAAYVNISDLDDVYRRTVVTGAGGLRATQIFNISVTDSAIGISDMTLTHDGRATRSVSQITNNFRIYVYNWSDDTYVLYNTVFASAIDVLTERSITAGYTDIIRNRQMLVLLQGEFPTAGGGSARAEIWTDYLGLTVSSIPVRRQNVTVNISAYDDNGISFCNWTFTNSSGDQGSWSQFVPTGGIYYLNTTGTTSIADGTYSVNVYCNDTLSNVRNTTTRVRIDNTPPQITVYTVPNETNLSVSHAVFSWNTTDIFGENMLCNVTIDSTVSATNIVSPHGDNVTRNITSIADGPHNWTVTCVDDAGNSNTSDIRSFIVDTRPPTIALTFPAAGAYVNVSPVNFTYTPTDANGLINCTINVDNINTTTIAPISATLTNFTIPSLSETLHRWNITCVDTLFKSNISVTRNFTLDITPPLIYLNTTNGITFNNTPTVLNFTAWDNIDANMTCNITVNGTVVAQNIGALNGTLISRTADLEDGEKAWNVTCMDDAGNMNISQTRFFRVIGGPLVSLQRPTNSSVTSGINVNFTYYAQDGDGIANCTLIIDQAINVTSTSITNVANNTFIINISDEGHHNWSVNCSDNAGTVGDSETRVITVDRTAPNIVLNLPADGQTLTVTPTVFNFTFLDELSPNGTCNLTIDGAVAGTNLNFIAVNASLAVRTQTVINGLHYWNVTCIDLGGNSNISLMRNFTVNATFPLVINVSSDKKQYQEGETILVNITVRNESNRPIASNGTLDLIYTNITATDVPWWNVSWAMRKPIYINETSNVARFAKAVAVNVTSLFGHISSCGGEIRVVRDSDLVEIAYNVLQGDDVTYCYIQFNATVSANQNNQQEYHVYYDNPGSPGPGYANITRPITILFDNFSPGALSANWTAGAGWDRSSGAPLAGGHAHVDGSVTSISILPSFDLETSGYDVVNLSFLWGLNGNWDAGEVIHFEISNNSGATWSSNITTLAGGLGALSNTYEMTLNRSYEVSTFLFRFRATTNAANEDGGFDNINVTGHRFIQNVTSWVGSEHVLVGRNQTNVTSTGNFSTNFSTLNRHEGNYSVVGRYTNPTGLNSPGSGWDWFRIVRDVFGPTVTLLIPANSSTNHSGVISFIYLANDVANDVVNCTIIIDGSFASYNTTPINETGNNTYAQALAEGQHTWQVNCTDTLNNNGSSNITTFFLDDTAPNVTLYAPNNTILSSPNVTFSFNATDNFDTLMECMINLSGPSPRNVSINATRNANSSILVTNLSDGNYAWNVTCRDNINNTALSEMATFSIDRAPTVNLFSPPDDYGVNATDIELFYNVSDGALANCTLFLNGTPVTGNTTPLLYTALDGNNNFTLTGMEYGRYNWSITCWDQNNFSTSSLTWRFQLDTDVPLVTLNAPADNQTIFSASVTFNWTVIDTDPSPLCNLTLDGVVNQSNIISNETIPTLRVISGVTGGNHSWNVTCWDGTGFTSSSETRNFSIDATVRVTLTSPANNSIDGDGTVSFSYTPESIAGFTLGFCDLYLNNVSNATHIGLISGSSDTFVIPAIPDGNHEWYVNCTDSANTVGVSETWRFVMDLQDPVVGARSPNGTAFTVSTVFFNWTATDNLDLVMTCDVRVNGTVQTPDDVLTPNASVANATYSGFTDGLFLWNVTCVDDGLRTGTSQLQNFTVQMPPTVLLSGPAAGNRTRVQNVTFTYTPSDNSNALANCTLLIDDLTNLTNMTISHAATNRFNITDIPEGFHSWNVTCTDPSGNTAMNISGRNFTIDLTPPTITLNSPGDGQAFNSNNATLNWTPADSSAPTITCNASIQNTTAILSSANITQANGTDFLATFSNLAEGNYNWSVTCRDDVGNIFTSETRTFIINQPDLDINDTQLSVNSTNPALGDTISIRANVTNIGGIPALNFIVAFWDGLPGVGIPIGNATGSLSPNQSAVLSIAWNVTPGYHEIWAVIDPANVIGELNETNNLATLNISALLANITHPQNATVTGDNTPDIHFNVTDFTAGSMDYTIFIDGTANGQTGTVASGSNTTLALSAIPDGVHRVIVQGTDALLRSRNSTPLTITIDTTPPNSTFVTRNGTYFPSGTFNITIRINDTLDRDINYSIFINETRNATGNLTNATNTNVTIDGLAEGYYSLIIEAFDDALNFANSTPIIIVVDAQAPVVTPISPADTTIFSTRNVNISYSVTDNLDPLLACTLTLNAAQVQTVNLTNGGTQNYSAVSLAEGTYLWNATCWDGNNVVNQVNNLAASATQSFSVSIAPNVTLLSPPNATITGNATTQFFFNVSDETGLTSCSVLIEGAAVDTRPGIDLILGGVNAFNVSGLNNTVLWGIACTDNSTGSATTITENRTLYVDLVAPQPAILTASDLWFNTATPNINITATDNFDTVIAWQFFVDGIVNTNGLIPNGTSMLAALSTVSDGAHTLLVQGTDDAGNSANSSAITINIDTQAPNVTLLEPANDTNLSATSVTLNFTATDNLVSTMMCTLYLDGSQVQTYNLTNATTESYFVPSLTSGYHLWNATCVDDANNTGMSSTFRFYVQLPDLTITSDNITASNLTPVENQTIEINATFFNIGLLNASNVTIRFYLGDPDFGGIQLAENFTISVFEFGTNVTLTINYTTVVGVNRIFAVIDPPTGTNGSIVEQNESNNKANLDILVGLYQVFAGGSDNTLRIADSGIITAFDWNETEVTGSNVIVADTESAINFLSLTAIGRNATNGTTVGTNDFAEIDTNFGTTAYNDSVNLTWTNGGAPHGLENITVFGRRILDVPVVNSTNTASFRTGILWDRSDGGAAYAGTQDIAFITVMNQSQAGQFGTYDFEIKIPATLRDYIAGGNTVTFYAEIK